MEQVYPSQFSKGVTHFMSLYNILSILKIFNTFSSLLYLLWWSINSDLCAFQDWSLCFPQSCGSFKIKSHRPSRWDSLGIPSPFVGSPGWEAWSRGQNFHNNGRTSLVLLFSSLWVTHLAGMGLDFIMTMALLLSCCNFFFVFVHRVFVFGRFQHPPVNGCSTASCNFGHRRRWTHVLCHFELEAL